ncbi:ribosome-binding factor A [Microbacterium murale]|uniref:Ribosome-binding factor A n=2 Tax=Microbacterium murale TaxID=1081040 RepID=A0ABQ1RT15_9MICO|nr:ribosome-binding factor A [Microbacterium murale]
MRGARGRPSFVTRKKKEMAGERQARLADRIRVILAERLERGLRDPRLGFVTITDVRVSGDLQHASAFYTVLGTDEERASSAAALASATGLLRSEVGKQLSTRLVPTLEFIPDALPENADNITALLRQAQERDAEVAKLASSATHAGDADPYIVRADEDDQQ